MPGYELIGYEEFKQIEKVFTESNGVLYKYGFDKLRKHYMIKEFEKQFAKKIKAKHALAVSSGSAALKVALQALGIKPHDEVITQAHTFIATAEAICEVGATPVIVDIDKTLNMCPKSLSRALTSKTKAIIPVHMSGVSVDFDKIISIINTSTKPDNYIFILEDNAQAPGGTYKGDYLGTIGDMGTFSFDGGKMLTTGEGGMIITNKEYLYERANSFSDHGHANNPNKPRGEDDCIGIGFNYKMMELQGAVGLGQLSKMDKIISAHRHNKNVILKELRDIIELRHIPNPKGDIGNSISFFLPNKKQATRFTTLWKKRGHATKNLPDALNWHFALNWNHMPLKHNGLQQSKDILERTISIPINYHMIIDELDKIVKDVKEIMNELK